MGTRAIFKGKVITKSEHGYVVDGKTYPSLAAATKAAAALAAA
jgi:hypothetical protein